MQRRTNKYLDRYATADYDVKLKARLQYNLYIFLIVSTLILIVFNTVEQLFATEPIAKDFSHIPNGFIAIGFYAFCLFLLIKGKIKLASNVLVISAFAVLWVIFFMKAHILGDRLQSLAYFVAMLSILTFMVAQKSHVILIYTCLNVLALFCFAYYMYANNFISRYVFIDFAINMGSAFLFTGFIGYINHWFNRKVMARLKGEIMVRTKAELELKEHKENLEKEVDQRTRELKASNEELQSLNEELSTMNEELYEQKEELHSTLNTLKIAQEKLVQSEKMASLGVLTAGVAHEINNPLNFIAGGISVLESQLADQIAPDKEMIGKSLDIIRTGVDRVTNIVRSLNHFSRKNESMNERCEIISILENCFQMLTPKLSKDIVINKHYHQTELYTVGNSGKLHQVFLNVLLNAIQAMDSKGQLDVEAILEGPNCIVKITDDGIGISEGNLTKIFDPFFTTKEPGKGTGLGLAIVNAIILEHQGHLHIKSEPGKGTELIIILNCES